MRTLAPSPDRVRFVVFRHGETDWNVEQRLQGHTDIPLNANGRDQARVLAAELAASAPHPTVVLSSDLSRARATGQTVADALGVPLLTDRALREVHCGEAEGQLRRDVIAKHGDEHWRRWCSSLPADFDVRYPGGESKRESLARVRGCLERYARTSTATCVAVSAHGAVIRYLIDACRTDHTTPLVVHNCALYVLWFTRGSGAWSLDLEH